MPHRLPRALAVPLAIAAAACRYDGPPDVTLQAPPEGAFVVGDPLVLRFSEPIDPQTLTVRIWPAQRDGEGELAKGLTPRMGDCTHGPCRGGTLTIAADGLSASLALEPRGLGKADVPGILEVAEGLADEGGNARGIPARFDFQFRRTRAVNTEPVEFDLGVYLIVAEIADPIPAVLTLITDIRVNPDGTTALAGAEGDEINGAAKNTRDPEDLIVDRGPEGYAVHTGGFVTLAEGERFLQTDPMDITLFMGPIVAVVADVRIDAKIVTSEETGRDRIDGTFSFSRLTLNPGEDGFDYPAGATSFSADRVPDGLVPEGTPQVCSDLCGAVTAMCDPPADFPPPGFCD